MTNATADLATPQNIAARAEEFKDKSEAELVIEISRSLPGYAAYAAASALLHERQHRSEKARFTGPSSFRVEPNSQNPWSSSSPVGMWAGCL